MPRFFVSKDAVSADNITITGADAHHIARSLRMAVGDGITVCDMDKIEYQCTLRRITDTEVEAEILSSYASATEPQYLATVYQALPKGDKLDSIIQKAVECGVYAIVPFESDRCVVRVKPEAEQKKTDRRCKIAVEAAKQSGRGILPEVKETISFEKMLEDASKADVKLFCYEGEGTMPLGKVLPVDAMNRMIEEGRTPTVSIVIGSEGGFSASEVNAAVQAGLTPIGLGKRILRTETAASFVLSALVYAMELF
jgi:16S rRNA (uracil1498-N3)-methyltransferase